jgi:hypothetical protein
VEIRSGGENPRRHWKIQSGGENLGWAKSGHGENPVKSGQGENPVKIGPGENPVRVRIWQRVQSGQGEIRSG